jgi:hypothetical protein
MNGGLGRFKRGGRVFACCGKKRGLQRLGGLGGHALLVDAQGELARSDDDRSHDSIKHSQRDTQAKIDGMSRRGGRSRWVWEGRDTARRVELRVDAKERATTRCLGLFKPVVDLLLPLSSRHSYPLILSILLSILIQYEFNHLWNCFPFGVFGPPLSFLSIL